MREASQIAMKHSMACIMNQGNCYSGICPLPCLSSSAEIRRREALRLFPISLSLGYLAKSMLTGSYPLQQPQAESRDRPLDIRSLTREELPPLQRMKLGMVAHAPWLLAKYVYAVLLMHQSVLLLP